MGHRDRYGFISQTEQIKSEPDNPKVMLMNLLLADDVVARLAPHEIAMGIRQLLSAEAGQELSVGNLDDMANVRQ